MKKRLLPPLLLLAVNAFAQFQFIAPMNGSSNHHPDRNIVLREGHELNATLLSNHSLFTIIGSLSGTHEYTITLSEDHGTINLIPAVPFSYGETVTINVNDGLRTSAGKKIAPMQFSFSIQKELTAAQKQGKEEFMRKMQMEGNIFPSAIDEPAERSASKLVKVIVNTNPTPNDIFFDYFSGTFTGSASWHIINNNGDSVYSKQNGSYLQDFKLNHNNYLTIFNGNKDQFEMYDSSYNLLKTFVVTNGYTTDEHELQIFPDGHYFIIGQDPEIVDMTQYNPAWQPNATVIYTVIQEFDKGDHLLFEWRSVDHISVLEALHENLANGYIDAVHTNAVEVDTDGNILVSHRHLDQITKIDIATGDFIWRLGGVNNQYTFTNDPAKFNYQHDVRRLANGDITLYDNNNWGGSPQTSYPKEYQLDEVNKKATLVWSYHHPLVSGKEVYGSAMGSVQRLSNGNTFICWGWINFNSGNPEYTEIDPDNNIVWEAQLTPGKYNVSYRAHRYDWTPCATPTAKYLKTTNITANAAKLKWSNSTGAVNYNVQYRVKGTSLWTTVSSGGNTNKNISGLVANTKYEWQVQSVCNAPAPPSSLYSDLKKFTTATSKVMLEVPGNINVYPNPANQVIHISLPDNSANAFEEELFNELGQRMYHVHDKGTEIQIPVSQLSNGMYLLKIFDGKNWMIHKVEVSH